MFKNPNISLDYFELRVELELNFHVWNQKKNTKKTQTKTTMQFIELANACEV